MTAFAPLLPLPPQDARQRTLVFCTAFTWPDAPLWHGWEGRYRIWLDAVAGSDLAWDQILLVDDGSAALPHWPDVTILGESDPLLCTAPVVLYHFTEHLGRRSVSDFPGWVRSFFFAARYAQANGFQKVVHIESDAFLVSARCRRYFDSADEGWIAMWCPRWERPESGIQIIAGGAMAAFCRLAERHYEEYAGVVIERDLPFTHVEKALRGDRHGEYLDRVPLDADFTMQASNVHGVEREVFFWWLPQALARYRSDRPGERDFYVRREVVAGRHDGLHQWDFLMALGKALRPASYVEIGASGTGPSDTGSLHCFECESVRVDGAVTPFFAAYGGLVAFVGGVDIVMLNGVRRFEAMLDDFIQAERACHARSLLLVQGCLPASRPDPATAATRPVGLRDGWRLLPVFAAAPPGAGGGVAGLSTGRAAGVSRARSSFAGAGRAADGDRGRVCRCTAVCRWVDWAVADVPAARQRPSGRRPGWDAPPVRPARVGDISRLAGFPRSANHRQ